MRNVSIGAMVEQLDGLRDTKDLSDWENGFVTSVLHQYLKAGKTTVDFSEKQIEKIKNIYDKHFS